MKDKNLPADNNSKTVEELTKKANQIIEQLEKEKNLENSLHNYQKLITLNNYQKLIKLNNIIVKKFQKKSKHITEITQQKIKNIVNKKNAKKT